jgi:hypothetical protein
LPLWQLPLDEPQVLPSAQRRVGAQEPPQSTSVSLPFFTPSVHAAAAQTPPEQLPLVQSLLPLQAWPVPHLEQLPPQSTSLSFWFITLSLQLAAWHVTLQTPLVQSLPASQSSPLSHLAHDPPPQSMSVSCPFR